MGRLTRDPEKRDTGKSSVTNFVLAVNRDYKSDDGEVKTDFVPIDIWGKSGENALRLLKKGSAVLIDGSLRIDSVKKNDEYTNFIKVVADKFQLLDKKEDRKTAVFERTSS